jgi:transposase InsO family protein
LQELLGQRRSTGQLDEDLSAVSRGKANAATPKEEAHSPSAGGFTGGSAQPENKIQLIHIQPGKPMQNGHVESFNGRLRAEY